MHMKIKHILICSICTLLSCKSLMTVQNKHSESDAGIVLDGKLHEEAWNDGANVLTVKSVLYSDDVNMGYCKLLKRDSFLFFSFQIQDTTSIIRMAESDYESIGTSDRVEIFFACDKQLESYYGFEIDISGRVEDFKAKYHRQFDFEWSFDKHLVYEVLRGNNQYTVEGKISIDFLKTYDLLFDNDTMFIGVFVADYLSKTDRTLVNWKSWVKITEPNPDFHQAKYFKTIVLK